MRREAAEESGGGKVRWRGRCGEEGAVKHIHALHHRLDGLPENIHIHDTRVIQHKTDRVVVEFPEDELTALTAACFDDLGSCHK